MNTKLTLPFLALATIGFASCQEKVSKEEKEEISQTAPDTVQTAIGELILPPPYATEPSVNQSKVVDWPEGQMPTAPAGFTVTKFADELDNPRNIQRRPEQPLRSTRPGQSFLCRQHGRTL